MAMIYVKRNGARTKKKAWSEEEDVVHYEVGVNSGKMAFNSGCPND